MAVVSEGPEMRASKVGFSSSSRAMAVSEELMHHAGAQFGTFGQGFVFADDAEAGQRGDHVNAILARRLPHVRD